MAKDKTSSKAAAKSAKPTASKPIEAVKAGRVAKTNDKPKAAAKEVAKKTAKAIEKKSKKAKKEPTPEPSSESESDDESSASSDSEEEVVAKPKANGSAKPVAAAAKDDSDSDDSESESDEEPPAKKAAAPKLNGKVNGAAAKDESDDSSDASDSDEEAVATNGAKAAADSSDEDDEDSEEDSSDDDESEKPKANGAATEEDDDDDSDSDSDSSEEEEEEVKPKVADKKRKAESDSAQTPKKAKTEESNATGNLFVGGLSWNIDEEWLTREFETFGTIKGVRIITDRDSGRSKGFGYVEFESADDAAKAMEEMNGAELDGRNIRLDFSTPRDNNAQKATPQQRSFDRAKTYGDKPNPPAATLFVGNLKFDVDEATVTEAFAEFGAIKGVRLPTDQETGRPKGFGYVEMFSVEDAQAAYEGLNGGEIAGRSIRLDYASERPKNDSPGGRGGRGGFGGRGGGRGGRGGFGDRGGRGGQRGGSRGGRGGTTNRGGFGDFSGKKTTF